MKGAVAIKLWTALPNRGKSGLDGRIFPVYDGDFAVFLN